MTFEIFLLGVLIVSTLTGLATEAVKNWFTERKKSYYANALAGYISIGLSIAVGAAYIVLTKTAINAQMAVYLIALIFLSWLSAMVGYDKVIQAISQFKEEK
jgi:hypothetical protein